MKEQDIRKIVRDEIIANSRTGSPITNPHQHNGVDNLKINQANILPGPRFNGTINMAQSTTYTLPLNGNPTSVTFYGGALTTSGSGKHAMVVGNAQLGGGFQFQPGTSTTVTLNNIKTNIIQGSASILIDDSNVNNTVIRNSESHIIYVEDISNTLVAVATITSYSSDFILVETALETGWSISGLWIIT